MSDRRVKLLSIAPYIIIAYATLLSLVCSFDAYPQKKNGTKKIDSLKFITEKAWIKSKDTTKNIYTIRNLRIKGNKKTKQHIINSELVLEVGYSATWDEIYKQAKVDENKVFNLKLFLDVYIYPENIENNNIDLIIALKERWYTFVLPIIDLGSRNFNDWILNQNGNGNRINYGVKIWQENMRGQRETIEFRIQGGFSKVFGLGYNFPAINKKQNLGLRIYGDYTEVLNVPYLIKNNKEAFLNNNSNDAVEYNGLLELNLRKSSFKNHTFALKYKNIYLNDEILKANPNYLLNNRNQRQYMSLRYRYAIDKRDRQNYALEGNAFFINIDQVGLRILDNISQLNLQVDYAKCIPLQNKFYFSFRVGGKTSFPSIQPPYLNRTLGYSGNFIRGYEVYSFVGEHFVLGKINLKKKLISTKIYISNIINIHQFNEIPLDIYIKLFSDHAYTYKNNVDYQLFENLNLNNIYINSIGLGIDIVTYYDIVLRLETSLNTINEVNYAINLSSDLFN